MPEAGIAISGVSNGRLRVEPTELKAEGGPFFPRLTVPIRLDLSPVNTSQMNCFTTITVECGLFIDGYQSKVSEAIAIAQHHTVRSNVSLPWTLEFPLDPFRVNGIEAMRHGDLKLRFDLALIVALVNRVQGPQGQTEVLTGLERSNSQIYVEVPQSHWVGKVLPALGSNKYFLVEVPTQNDHTSSAWTLIQKAESAFGRWDTKAVFAHCREAASALTSLIEKNRSGDSFAKQERWGRAVKEFNHFASLDLHLEDIRAGTTHSSEQVKIEKIDAECLLIFTKALAKYAEELSR